MGRCFSVHPEETSKHKGYPSTRVCNPFDVCLFSKYETSPNQPVTLNMGMHMPSWYDIKGLDDRAQEDLKGIQASFDIGSLNKVIEVKSYSPL